MEYAEAGISPGGAERNRAYLEETAADGRPRVTLDPSISEERLMLLFDPQTSGGLFFAAPADEAGAVERAFEAAEQPLWRVGQFVAGSAVRVV
jgi:selenide, water dikinase